jgi:hypothetical protein
MSKIEVNAIEPQSGTTLTLGASGDTVTLAAGASQSGFGRSGSVNWDTTPKTSGFTAVSGNGYFVNTTAGAITVTLPITPSAGDIISIADYANTSATNNITVGRNGSLIDGVSIDAKININGQVYTLVYVDATEGWKTVNQTFNQIATAAFVAATGGTITTCGDYKIHSFTGPGTFTVTNAGNAGGSNSVDYLVVAGGGGGGGQYIGGGGGAGGFRESVPSPAAWTASPLANPGGSLPVSVQGYPITVGSGGSGGSSCGATDATSGINSVFSTITSAGGGFGKQDQTNPANPGSGGPGGSGGGGNGGGCGSNTGPGNRAGGSGNTPPTSPSQGNNGGTGFGVSGGNFFAGAGGGGAGAVGGNASSNVGGNGGAGVTSSINGTPTARAGGGGGNNYNGGTQGTGGTGGGGAANQNSPGVAGTVNTGGGGGGTDSRPGPNSGGAGGSGIVVIRYKFQ